MGFPSPVVAEPDEGFVMARMLVLLQMAAG